MFFKRWSIAFLPGLCALLALAPCQVSPAFAAETTSHYQSPEMFGFSNLMVRVGTKGRRYSECPDPVLAVELAIECFRNEDPECIVSRYSPRFRAFHNEIEVPSFTNNPEFWRATFVYYDLSFTPSFIQRVGKDLVSIRYIEEFRFFDGEVLKQHEHALATVGRQCRIVKWDQYGDNQEQEAVFRKFLDIFFVPQ